MKRVVKKRTVLTEITEFGSMPVGEEYTTYEYDDKPIITGEHSDSRKVYEILKMLVNTGMSDNDIHLFLADNFGPGHAYFTTLRLIRSKNDQEKSNI